MNAPTLTPAQQYVKDQALEAAARALKRAFAFVQMHGGHIGFKKIMRSKGVPPVLVRWDDDDALRCYDANSYELMYQSLPGKHDQLATPPAKPGHAA